MNRWFSLRRPQPQIDEPLPSSVASATLSDEELLRKFVIERDDQAFAQLVGRHSGMVMGVCRRVLGMHDAEDAFQAVFLILARKADAVRHGDSLPAWLHKTAFRTALRARAERSGRREQSTEGFDMIAHDACAQIASDHDGSIVDEELNRLPERYRLPLYLCCIEGKSLEVAARQLGWSVGSVKGRMERGRSELRRRLLLRRVPFALGIVALATLAPTAQAASISVAPSLIASTVQAGMQHAVGRSALGYVSQHALHLAQGSWKVMTLTALKITVCSVTFTGLLVWGGSRLPSPAVAGPGLSGIVLEASMPSAPTEELQLALAEEGNRAKTGPRDGDAPRTGPRDGDQPRTGPRDGERPRVEGAREGEPRRTAEGAREGERRTAEAAPRTNPIEGFKPQNDREAALMQMILQLQREVTELRCTVQAREGVAPAMRREGEAGVRREGDAGVRREGEAGVRREGAKEGEAPRREGEGARPAGREGDGAKPRTGPRDGEGTKTGPRDGEGSKTGPRDGDAPKKE